jgi:hypothetical protein
MFVRRCRGVGASLGQVDVGEERFGKRKEGRQAQPPRDIESTFKRRACRVQLSAQQVAASDECQGPGVDRADVGLAGQPRSLAQLAKGVCVAPDVGQRDASARVSPGPLGRVVPRQGRRARSQRCRRS